MLKLKIKKIQICDGAHESKMSLEEIEKTIKDKFYNRSIKFMIISSFSKLLALPFIAYMSYKISQIILLTPDDRMFSAFIDQASLISVGLASISIFVLCSKLKKEEDKSRIDFTVDIISKSEDLKNDDLEKKEQIAKCLISKVFE